MEIKKELDEKIIKIIVKMAQKGMIRSSADTSATPAESVTFDYLYKDYDGDFEPEWKNIITINFVENTFAWNPEISNPAKLLQQLVRKYNSIHEEICEINI